MARALGDRGRRPHHGPRHPPDRHAAVDRRALVRGGRHRAPAPPQDQHRGRLARDRHPRIRRVRGHHQLAAVPREVSQIRLDFDTATVELDHLYGYGDDNWSVHPIDSAADEVNQAWAGEPRGQSSGHGAQFKRIADALDGRAAPPVPVAEARRTLELLAAIYASAFTGKRVRAGDIDPTSPFYQRMDGSGTPGPTSSDDELTNHSGETPMTLQLDDDGTALSITKGDLEILRYVYRPDNDQFESPGPTSSPCATSPGTR
nr:hypothetical protein GCM10025732_29200 [Glycomyces mayteni]